MVLLTIMLKFFFVSLIILSLLVLPINPAYTQENNSSASAQVIQVDHVANLRDRVLERIILFFKFNPNSSEEYQSQLAEKRLAELKYVVDSDNWDPIEETSSRYSSYLGRLTKFVLDHRMLNKKDDLLKMYKRHEQVLDQLVKNFEYESGFWLLLQHDINANKIYQQQIQDLK